MKKLFIIVFVIALLIIGYAHDQFVWCKKLIFGEPTTHVIQQGEYLSIIAKKYYGNSDYWRELALINRAPNSNLVFPGEEIIIPSLDVIKEIRRTSWLSKVNSYIKSEEDIIARLKVGEEPVLAEKTMEPQTMPEKLLEEPQTMTPMAEETSIPSEMAYSSNPTEQQPVQSGSSLSPTLALIGALFVVSLVAIYFIRKKRRSQNITIVDDDELNILGGDSDSEPDYQEYLKNKSRRNKKVLVD
jgi:LysM repeat protein